jgi:hypothetical protein
LPISIFSRSTGVALDHDLFFPQRQVEQHPMTASEVARITGLAKAATPVE